MYIKKVVRAPYICTVPGGGVRAIKCYPDATTFIINGKKIGYSAKESTIIVPLDALGDINMYKMRVIEFLDSERCERQKQ